MAERSMVFPVEEFRSRLRNLQRRLDADDLDALLLTSAQDIFYISGFLTRFWESPARPWFVIVPASGPPVAVIPSIGQSLMQRTWITDIRVWDAPAPEDDGVSLLSDTICALVPEGAKVGLPMGPETQLRMPLADFQRVAQAIAPRQFVDGTSPLQRTREIKSRREIEKIARACEIAGRAFSRVSEFARRGRPQDRVFRDFQRALLEEGADWVGYVAGGAGGDGYLDVISPASSDPLREGDILMLDTGAVHRGYYCDFDRNFAIGRASEAARKTHAALWEATQDALSALRPGMRACEAFEMLHQGLLRRGVEPCGGRMGHGLGVALTEWPSFSRADQTELRAGMVLTLEPSAYVGAGRMLVHEENIVLREDGAELLTARAPRDLPELA